MPSSVGTVRRCGGITLSVLWVSHSAWPIVTLCCEVWRGNMVDPSKYGDVVEMHSAAQARSEERR